MDPDRRKLLVLDLDETLVFADAELDAPDFIVGPYSIRKRPHVDAFIAAVRATFHVAVWTASTEKYAGCVVHELFGDPHGLAFVWTVDRCTMRYDPELREAVQVKRLAKLKRRGWKLSDVVMVDDSPEKHPLNWGNLVRVAPFYGDPADDELPALAAYLASISEAPDVRAIDKRSWRRGMR